VPVTPGGRRGGRLEVYARDFAPLATGLQPLSSGLQASHACYLRIKAGILRYFLENSYLRNIIHMPRPNAREPAPQSVGASPKRKK